MALSDTHGHEREVEVPEGDILVFAGDFAWSGNHGEWSSWIEWLRSLPHRFKIVVAGNHDGILTQPFFRHQVEEVAAYLEGASVLAGGLKVFGSPFIPRTGFGWSFEAASSRLRRIWTGVPDDTDLIVSHGPPLGAVDQDHTGAHLGDPEFARMLGRWHEERSSPPPQAIVCGHIHEAHGEGLVMGIRTHNVAVCDAQYDPVHPATIFTLDPR